MLPTAEQTQAALQSARIGIWSYDVRTGAVAWSPEVERQFGVESGSFDGTFEAYLKLLPDEERPNVQAVVEQAIADKEQFFVLRHWIQPHDGSERRFVEGWGRVLLDEAGKVTGMTGAVIDVTSRQRAQESVEAYQRELELVAELSTDYVYEVDMSNPTLFPRIVAGSFERTTGYSPAEVQAGGGWAALIHEEDRAQVGQVFEEIGKGKPIVIEYRIHDGHGGVRWLRDRVMPVLEGGAPVKLVGGVQDITEVKELQAQLAHAQKMEALAQLSGSVAHDFNNLLTVMMGAADTLINEDPDPTQRQAAHGDLSGAIERASDLTHSLLAFGRRQVGPLTPIPFVAVVLKSQSILRRALGSDHQLIFEVQERPALVQAAVRGDRGQLELILLNLVLNARDSQPRDKAVRVSIQLTRLEADDPVRPAELTPETYIEIRVSDRGSGMDAETQARIFEPFFTTKTSSKGTGLGLSTVYGVVRSWQGGIHVDSVIGEGTTMRVFLPIHGTPVAPIEDPRPRDGTVGGTECVLVVEDDPMVKRAAERALEKHGYQVFSFDSAEALLQDVDRLAPEAQLLLSDVRLPNRDGVSLADELKERFPHLKVLLMSGYVELDDQREIIASGRYGFLPKPFSPTGLARRIRELLD